MSRAIRMLGFYDALKQEGYQLPDGCADVRLLMPVDGVMQLEYVVSLMPEALQQVGRALVRLGEEAK